jgi:N-methylhydantoinase A
MVDTAFFEGPVLPPGASISGPAIVAEPTTTIVVPPGATAQLSGQGNYVIATGAVR